MCILQGLKSRSLIRLCDGFVSADSNGFRDARFVSVESKGFRVIGGLFAGVGVLS